MIRLLNLNLVNLLPLLCGITIIIVGYLKLWKLRKSETPQHIGIFGIWLMGIIALLLGVFGQVVSMINTFDAIALTGDISASVVAQGIKNSYKPTMIGLLVLIISLIVWGILKGIKQRKVIAISLD
ncbi:MotA/TolQ/ExbB proton channel family protein [Labilibacter sediminis]|nr:MotA/TolQ/ExbB proton channel family protein [Labilibacter sediminis]